MTCCCDYRFQFNYMRRPTRFWYPTQSAFEPQNSPHIFSSGESRSESSSSITFDITDVFLDRAAGAGGSLVAPFDVNPTSGIIARAVFGNPNEVGGYNLGGVEQWETSYSSLPTPPAGSPPDFSDANAAVGVRHIAAMPDGSFKMLISRNYTKVITLQRWFNIGWDVWSLSSSGTWSYDGDRYEPFGTVNYSPSPNPTFPQTGQERIATDSSGNTYVLIPKIVDVRGETTQLAFVGDSLNSPIYTFDTAAVPRFLGVTPSGTLLVCGSDLDGAGGPGLLHLSSGGGVLWSYGSNLDCFGAAADANGNVLVAGNLDGDAAVLLDSDGNEVWTYEGNGVGMSCITEKNGHESIVAYRNASTGIVTLAHLDKTGGEMNKRVVGGTFTAPTLQMYPPPVWIDGKHEVFSP